MPEQQQPEPKPPEFYCPSCRKLVERPLQCGDCLALICRDCGAPLETPDELGMG